MVASVRMQQSHGVSTRLRPLIAVLCAFSFGGHGSPVCSMRCEQSTVQTSTKHCRLHSPAAKRPDEHKQQRKEESHPLTPRATIAGRQARGPFLKRKKSR